MVDNNKNQLMKVYLDGNNHFKHVLTNDVVNQMTMIENRFPLTKLPVCAGCERLGLWSKGMNCTCKVCGSVTKKPLTYSEYLASGYDVDATGQTAKSILQEEMKVREIILPDYTHQINKARERCTYET